MNKTVILGADHGGFILKEILLKWLKDHHWKVIDVGTFAVEPSVDYPDYIEKVAEAVRHGKAQKGILICGSGMGMSIGANRFKGIRAALCWNQKSARLARQHNDANVLVLGERLLRVSTALQCLETFLQTPFTGEERHLRRIRKIDTYKEEI